MNKKQEEGIDRNWHPEFQKYTEAIVSAPEYEGLYFERKKDTQIKWVATKKSSAGQKRLAWWNKKCEELGIPVKSGNYAVAVREIHPTKKHVCQICGKALSIYYEYPTKQTLSKINQKLGIKLNQTDYTIKEIIEQFCKNTDDLKSIAGIFKIKSFKDSDDLIRQIYDTHVAKCSGKLSPGAMSNCPDRFDGYHSDGLCCRQFTDKGRHTDNMKTYVQDRRAYEEWSDGNYNLANRLMGEYQKAPKCTCPVCGETAKMTADHIGPISLGFCHSTNFAPMCKACNSAKNNRLSLSDVRKLLTLEADGNQVVSWHSQYIWDKYKNTITSDEDARKLSSLMLKCHQNVLKLFSLIYQKGGEEFLQTYLHPEYSMYDYRFSDFNPLEPDKLKIHESPLDSENKRKNQKRYLRIAFESLKKFDMKKNRKVTFYTDQFSQETAAIMQSIKARNFTQADQEVRKLIALLCDKIITSESE